MYQLLWSLNVRSDGAYGCKQANLHNSVIFRLFYYLFLYLILLVCTKHGHPDSWYDSYSQM